MRIAQRMGIQNEPAANKCTVFEAEMRRRLWWSLMLFDTRIGELADYKTTMLAPTWNCRIPLNVSDSDLRAEMKEPPAVQSKTTEALFAVVRSELAEFIRHHPFYLDFTNPALKPIAKDIPMGGDLTVLEQMIEEEYFKFCDQENPLHFMTIWTTRAYISKCRLVEVYSRYSTSSTPINQTGVQRDAAISHAFSMLECDTKIMTSPITKGYLWYLRLHFPFTAYVHIVQDLRRRPFSTQAERAWEIMSDNYEARFESLMKDLTNDNPLFTTFSKVVLQAWDVLEAAMKKSGRTLTSPPRIVSSIKQKLAEISFHAGTEQQPNSGMSPAIDDFLTPMSMDFGMGEQGGYIGADPNVCSGILGQDSLPVDMGQLNWASMDWLGYR